MDCVRACRFEAIGKVGGRIRISEECSYCGQCIDVCKSDVLKAGKTGFRVLAGGKEGSTVMFGEECASFVDDFEVLEKIEKVLNHYQEKAMLRPGSSRKKERLGEVIRRLGLEAFME